MIALWLLPILLFQTPATNAGIPPARKASVVCVLPIQGEMDALTVSGLAQRLAQAKNAGADAIVLQLDTPGGDLLATLELCRQIKSEYPANTVAWIRPRAYSAGVITALACREIIVSSRRSGHDERLARAFVCVGDELWLVEDAGRGERYVVDVNEYKIVFGQEPIRLRGAEPMPEPTQDEPQTSQESDEISPPLVPFRTDALRQPANTDTNTTASIEPALSDVQRNQSLLPSRALLTSADAARLKVISQIDTADELLTLQADEALAFGLACATIARNKFLLLPRLGASNWRACSPAGGCARCLWPFL